METGWPAGIGPWLSSRRRVTARVEGTLTQSREGLVGSQTRSSGEGRLYNQ